ncbi:hypothetical protein KW785_03570 [Candidatus Parcubacteria bacterium]|nr:hypothetical protein [Candidatus Parcubacteria bacterium]
MTTDDPEVMIAAGILLKLLEAVSHGAINQLNEAMEQFSIVGVIRPG